MAKFVLIIDGSIRVLGSISLELGTYTRHIKQYGIRNSDFQLAIHLLRPFPSTAYQQTKPGFAQLEKHCDTESILWSMDNRDKASDRS